MSFLGLGKKEEEPLPPVPMQSASLTPDKVLELRSQGQSNNQIIQTLQSQGFDSKQIFDALSQADLAGNHQQNISGQPVVPGQLPNPPMQPSMNPPDMGPPPGNMPPQNQPVEMPPIESLPPPGAQGSAPMMPPMQSPEKMDEIVGRVEEIAEAIIDEKWNEIVKSINKIIDWKDRTEAKISKIDQEFVDLQRSYDNLSKGVLGKIGEYDKNIGNIGADIKAMEKVFQKVLPSLTESVHSLERISGDFKDKHNNR